jgi:3-hydroxymyristoyl/3-hydroxydecanoyl-(acyl carrier protein) dehydratase
MAQAASFSVYPYFQAGGDIENMSRNFQCILVGVDSARFRKPVIPGDTLRIETTVTRCRGKLWGFSCEITVDGKPVADAEILANLASNLPSEGAPSS